MKKFKEVTIKDKRGNSVGQFLAETFPDENGCITIYLNEPNYSKDIIALDYKFTATQLNTSVTITIDNDTFITIIKELDSLRAFKFTNS